MGDVLYAKREETDRKPVPAKTPSSRNLPIQRAGSPIHSPLYAQVLGNQPPPQLRLSTPRSTETTPQKEEASVHPDAVVEEELAEAQAAVPQEELSSPAEQVLILPREPIQILGEPHHIEYREINGEIVPGISSIDWLQVDSIFQELRSKNLLGANQNIRTYRRNVQDLSKQVNDLEKVTDAISTKINRLREEKAASRRGKSVKSISKRSKEIDDQIAKLLGERRDKNRVKGTKIDELNQNIRWFIQEAVTINSTVVARILGASMVPIVLATDLPNTAPANHYRYHTGTQTDPIPLIWYKPTSHYGTISVTDDPNSHAGGPTPVVLSPHVQQTVTDAGGNQHQFGVAQQNFAVDAADHAFAAGRIWRNTPRHMSSRGIQKALNTVLTGMGYNPSGHGKDGDHIRDLGFGGQDDISNYWPLDSATNQLSFTGWRSLYYLNYKKKQLRTGNWELEKAPLNSGTLVSKFFRIIGAEAATRPHGNNTPDSGSDTSWDNPGIVLAQDGTPIQEG